MAYGRVRREGEAIQSGVAATALQRADVRTKRGDWQEIQKSALAMVQQIQKTARVLVPGCPAGGAIWQWFDSDKKTARRLMGRAV